MSRLLGVDFGTVRVGLAVSDRDRKIGSPLTTYARRSNEQDEQFYRKLVEEEEIGGLVVGLPMHCDGREGIKAVEARAYGKWLQETTGLPVVFWDERFTTVEAEGFLQDAGLTSKRRKERRDRVAAQILLQGYLDAGCPCEEQFATIISTERDVARNSEDHAMGLPKPKSTPLCAVDEYLKVERAAKERHEYLDGVVIAMAGESDEHADISMNLAGLIHSQLKGSPCRGRTKDTQVRSGPTLKSGETTRGMFSYPDIVVICGEPKHLDEKADVIENPTAIVEVLSPSTEAFDRGEKFTRYQKWNPTLTEYMIVSQDQPQIEHFSRQTDGAWSYRRHTGLESAVVITSISCTLKLADVYDRVDFTKDANDEAEGPSSPT